MLLNSSRELAEASVSIGPLRERLQLIGVRVAAPSSRRRGDGLGPIDLSLESRQRIALVGGPGSGKTMLLKTLAGLHGVRRGRIVWDGIDLSGRGSLAMSNHIAYLSQDPSWARRRLRDLLNLSDAAPDDAAQRLLRTCGIDAITRRLPDGMDALVGSGDLSFGERKTVALAGLIRGDASVLLLDDPTGGLGKREARKLLRVIFSANQNATVIVALARPVSLKSFDQVVELRRGRVVFNGTPTAWLVRTERAQRGTVPAGGKKGRTSTTVEMKGP